MIRPITFRFFIWKQVPALICCCLVLTIIQIISVTPSSAQTIDSIAFSTLTNKINALEQHPLLKNGILSFSIRSLQSGEELLQRNGQRAVPSASTLKLITTATALEVLGPNYRFQTALEYDGSISANRLNGNLIIRGGGDPTLGSERFGGQTDSCTVFNKWLEAIQALGIQEISGQLILDESFFDPQGIGEGWQWNDIANYYGAGVYGINWNENANRIHLYSTSVGRTARILSVFPSHSEDQFTSEVVVTAAGTPDKSVILPQHLKGSFVITGTIPYSKNGHTIKGALLQPSKYLHTAFINFLASHGIRFIPSNYAAVTGVRKLIDLHASPALTDIARQINLWSVNIYAEALLKMLARTKTGKTDYKAAIEEIRKHWIARGHSWEGFSLKDGSGLSPANAVTASGLTTLLQLARQQTTSTDFMSTLAIAGMNGTVRNKQFGTKRNVYAKSGTIEATRGYAGYIQARSGEWLSFSLIARHYEPESGNQITQLLAEIVRLAGDL